MWDFPRPGERPHYGRCPEGKKPGLFSLGDEGGWGGRASPAFQRALG
ncbi:unnamed protein product [Pararhodospirillum photometricum DSM 122]|uniref:Uncharacterized protein n=1 Tax=Pararhodospirillum photometricum DSM 122 TaxID=1150469 RepID=H6SK89_PARPM|nr:unnamed protein product [Pararhodospirillum photometricum DSM 122]